ncbi:putative membrane protein [Listeria floridensis FSL S10-1187]|uniref:Membrane protein n=1 Tax=Listeria floridensis FSL S10-1187 TaxID=1265817 RepID=A0ABN0RCW5_9LIST|nr:threonine/serine exporter family protein [Listeria floridensis]EUJ27444.1 putative membrane protein [Listeria floridensis FSL S10-1187]
MIFELFYHFIFSFIASCAFGFLCRIPNKTIIAGGIVGGAGWIGYHFLSENGFNVFITSFCCSLILSTLSYTYSYIRKYPSTVYFIPGLVPVVPGITFYEVFKELFIGHTGIAQVTFFNVIASAVALACGIIIGNIIFLILIKPFLKRTKAVLR